MTAKINTSCGFMCLNDERMVENAKKMHNVFSRHNEVEVRTLMETKVKSYNRVDTPFGVAFVRSYQNAFLMQCKYNRESQNHNLEIITVSF